MTYAKIENDGFTIVPKPKWFNNSGQPLSDEELKVHGYLPVEYNPPAYDPLTENLVQNPIDDWLIKEDHVEATYTVTPIPLEEAVEQARQRAHDRVNQHYNELTNTLASDYPENEQKSWHVQVLEAEEIMSGSGKPTPWIDHASIARGVTREQMAALIKAQDTSYRQYHGTWSGIRQTLRDQINEVPIDEDAVDTLEGINWPSNE